MNIAEEGGKGKLIPFSPPCKCRGKAEQDDNHPCVFSEVKRKAPIIEQIYQKHSKKLSKQSKNKAINKVSTTLFSTSTRASTTYIQSNGLSNKGRN